MTEKIKKITVFLSAALLISSASALTSCSSDTQNEGEMTSDILNSSDTTYDDYYQSVIAALESQLKSEAEDRYISEYEYQQKLNELKEQLSGMSTPKPDAPSSPLDTLGEVETNTPIENAPTHVDGKMSFRYGIVGGTITIYEYLGGTDTVAIPSTINGVRVTAIGESAFADSSVTTVVIPPSVKTIGWFAFSGCKSLSAISIPASVENIGYDAFEGCKSLNILCTQNSYASQYAKSFGIPYQII